MGARPRLAGKVLAILLAAGGIHEARVTQECVSSASVDAAFATNGWP